MTKTTVVNAVYGRRDHLKRHNASTPQCRAFGWCISQRAECLAASLLFQAHASCSLLRRGVTAMRLASQPLLSGAPGFRAQRRRAGDSRAKRQRGQLLCASADPAPAGGGPNKAEAGSEESWWRELWRRRPQAARLAVPSIFAPPVAPGAGETPSVRWSLFESDPSLNQSLISEGTTISQLFDQDKWERHRRVSRYWRHATPLSLVTSTVFRRIAGPIYALTAFAAAVCAYNLWLVHSYSALPMLSLHLAPYTLISPMVGLLLVFRTNFSYARFLEGRLLWGSAVRHVRDAARLSTTYLAPSAGRQALLGYLQAWAWLLKAHLRAGRSRVDPADVTAYKDDPTKDVQACLPPHLATPLLSATNRPFVTLLSLTALLRHLRGGMPDYATRRLDEILVELGACAGGCERILSTPMPLSYTRFTGRSLIAWLVTLPLALWPLMQWSTVPAMFALSFIVLGIDEIGVEIEEPFCILPLQALCEAIRRDVGIAEQQSAQLRVAWPGGMGYEEGVGAEQQAALAAMQDGLDWGKDAPPLAA